MTAGRYKVTLAVSVALALACAGVSLCVGSVDISPRDILGILGGSKEGAESVIVMQLRLPRIVAAILTGMSLALAGCGLQSVFRNPLAEPSITGVSAGASLGAVIAIMFLSGTFALQICAFAFSAMASLLVCAIGTDSGKVNPTYTLLGGIAVNALCGAFVGLFMYATRESGLKSFVFWALGSFDKCDWDTVLVCMAISLPTYAIMFTQSKNLNALLLGDRQAFNIGVNVRKTQILVIASAVAMTSASVAICGTIGFIGLIIPHIARMLCGSDNRKTMPVSAALGAALAVCADLTARAVSPNDPIPIGVLTALLGAPFFVYILRKTRTNA